MSGLLDYFSDDQNLEKLGYGLLGFAGGAMGQPNTGQAIGQGIQQALPMYMQMSAQQKAKAEEEAKKQQYQKMLQGNYANDPRMQNLMGTLPPDVGSKMMAEQALETGASQKPMSIREWEMYQKMTPPQKEQYLRMKRAQKIIDTGSGFEAVSPTDPTRTDFVAGKNLAPSELPSTKEAQAAATKRGAASAEAEAEEEKNAANAQETLDILNGAEDIISKATGSGIGSAADFIAGLVGQSTVGSKGIASLKILQSKLLQFVPRMEGPQSDRDVQIYIDATGNIANPDTPRGDKMAALETIRGLQKKYLPDSAGSLDAKKSSQKRLKYNPSTGAFE